MKKIKISIIFLVLVILLVVIVRYFSSVNIPILEPKGIIAQKEYDLIVFALALSLVVIIPVFFLLFFFAYRYRENNHKHVKYSPDLRGNKFLEVIWWVIPTVIILILSVITWQSSHALDPYKAIASTKKPVQIEVVALDWRWLFIYPKYNVASINLMDIPNNTPISLRLTSDAPMNSFWVPALAGQIYAMPGMSTELHLMANYYGNFYGSSANISGNGFAKMNFIVRSNSVLKYNMWIANLKKSKNTLSLVDYNKLSKPSLNSSVTYFSKVNKNLYEDIIMKYMAPVTNDKTVMNSSRGSM